MKNAIIPTLMGRNSGPPEETKLAAATTASELEKRARVEGSAIREEAKMMGMTPALFTCATGAAEGTVFRHCLERVRDTLLYIPTIYIPIYTIYTLHIVHIYTIFYM